MIEQAEESIHDLAQSAREQGRRVEDKVARTFDENPLAVGLAVVAIGIGVGLAIPISRREQRWMGPSRERLGRKVEQAAREAIDKAGEAGTRAIDKAAAETQQPALPH